MLNEIMSIDGKYTFTVGEWFHGSLPTDVVALRVITAAWDMDILALDYAERVAFRRTEMGLPLDDTDLANLDHALMEAEKELALLAPAGYEIGYDYDGSFGCWRDVDFSSEPVDASDMPEDPWAEAYSSFGDDVVPW